jgi:hypothetical protein
MAAPLKLADARTRKGILSKIRQGYRLRAACAAHGVDYSTFRRWLREGEPPENPDEDPLSETYCKRTDVVLLTAAERNTLQYKRQFYHDVQIANEIYRGKLDNAIQKAAGTNFRDLLTYGRIRFPDDYVDPQAKPVGPNLQVSTTTTADGATTTFASIAADAIADMTDNEQGDA